MIRVIDHNGDVVVQKVTKPDGSLVRYQHGVPGNQMTPAATLEAARAAIGKGQTAQQAA